MSSWFHHRRVKPASPSVRPCLEALEERVVLNAPPTLAPLMPQTLAETMPDHVQLSATDPDNDPLSFSGTGLPAGLSLSASGLLTGTLAYSAASAGLTVTLLSTLTVSDGQASDTATLPWTLIDTNRFPSFTAQAATEGQGVSVDLHGNDMIAGDTLSYSASSLPAGLSINASSGVVSGVPSYRDSSNGTVSTYFATLSLHDQNGATDTVVVPWGVTDSPPLSDSSWSGAEGATLSLGTGNPTAALSYSASSLPQGLSINAATGSITGIVGYANASSGATATLTATLSASDSLGLLATAALTFTLADTNRLPGVGRQASGVGQAVSLDEHGTDNTGTNSLSYSASGLPLGVSIDPVSGLIGSAVGTSAASYGSIVAYSPVVTLNDDHGGTDTRSFAWLVSNPSFNWTAVPGSGPSLGTIAGQSSAEGQVVGLWLSAYSPSMYPLTFTAMDLPEGLSIDPTSGMISGTVGYDAAEEFGGSWSPLVVVSDGHGGADWHSFGWVISDTPRAPSLTSIASQSSAAGDGVSLQVQASDADGNSLFYDATGLPDGLDIDPDSGLISGSIASWAGSSTAYSVTVTVDDGVAAPVSATFAWSVGVSNHAPVWGSIAAQANAAGDSVDVFLSAGDSDDDAVAYSASGLPAGLSMDPGTGEVTGIIASAAAGASPHTVTVVASDGQAATSQTFLWSVSAVGLGAVSDQSGVVGDNVSVAVSGTDSGGGTLTYSATNLPTGLSVNSSTGLITGTLGVGGVGSHAVTLSASDGTASANQTLSWTVARLALEAPATQHSAEGARVSLQLQGTDVGGTPTYSATNLPAGLSLNASSGLITGTVGLSAHGSSPYQVSVTLHDGTVSVTQSFVWAVAAKIALLNPGVQNSASGDSVSLALTGSEAGGTLTYTVSGAPAGLSINSSTGLISGTLGSNTAQSNPYAVTVTASDGTGSSSVVFNWNVANLYLPSPGIQSNLDGDSVSLALGAHYHGTATLSYTATGLPSWLSLDGSTGQITGTLGMTADVSAPYEVTVSVSAGTLTTSQVFEWDVQPRVSLDDPGDQSNVGGDTVSLALSASDAASGTLTYSAVGLPMGLSLNSSTGLISGTLSGMAMSGMPYTVTLTVSDGTASVSQTLSWSVAGLGLDDPTEQQTVKGQSASLSLHGWSSDGGSVTYSASGLPAGLSVNSSTGLISGTPGTVGLYLVGVTASEWGNSVSQQFVWDVLGVGLTNPGERTGTEGDSVSLTLQGATGNGGTLSYSATGLPTGLSLNASTGLISGTIAAGAAQAGPFFVTVVVSDGTLSSQEQFTWTVNPYVSLTPFADQSGTEGASVSLQVLATDAGTLGLSYSASGLPGGLSINGSTGLISGTISAGAAVSGPAEVTVTVSDGTYSSTESFEWALAPSAAPAAPTLTDPGTQSSQAGDDVELQISATDAAGYTLWYDATGLPDGLFIDPETGLITGTVYDGDVTNTPYSVTVTVDDGVGETTTLSFLWLANPSPISVQVCPPSLAEGNDTGSIMVGSFTTPDLNSCEADFTVVVDWGDGSTSQGAITGDDGSFTVSGDHTYATAGSYTLTLTVTKDDGSSATGSGTANVSNAPLALEDGFEQGLLVGQSTGVVVAVLTDSNLGLTAGSFTVEIDPGDGSSPVAGTLTALGSGEWEVILSHGYGAVGTYTAAVTVTDPHGAHQTVNATVQVGDVEAGVPSQLTVAQFATADPLAPASSYTVTIWWGDGQSDSGSVDVSSGLLTVYGTHTYANDSIDQPGGAYVVSVQVVGPGTAVLTASHPVVVVRPQVALQLANLAAQADGTVETQRIAAFEVPNNTDPAGEFTATINWGDGTSSVGTVSGSNGLFEVAGQHKYDQPGSHAIEVIVGQGWSAFLRAAIGRAKEETFKGITAYTKGHWDPKFAERVGVLRLLYDMEVHFANTDAALKAEVIRTDLLTDAEKTDRLTKLEAERKRNLLEIRDRYQRIVRDLIIENSPALVFDGVVVSGTPTAQNIMNALFPSSDAAITLAKIANPDAAASKEMQAILKEADQGVQGGFGGSLPGISFGTFRSANWKVTLASARGANLALLSTSGTVYLKGNPVDLSSGLQTAWKAIGKAALQGADSKVAPHTIVEGLENQTLFKASINWGRLRR